jgi:hypothetical protein
MPSPVPTPVAAALGLVPTVLGGVRRLPGKAVQLPVYAVSHTLTSLGTARQGYDNLAERGERLIARLRGTSFDELEDSLEDTLQGTPLAKPYDRVEDALEDAAEGVTQLVRKGRKVTDVGRKAADEVDAQAPKGAPTPAATQPDSTRIDTAASSGVVQTVEQVSAAVGGTVLPHDELPLPDYDHLTLGSLRGRMRSLDLPQLVSIRAYEKAHADRLPIVTMLDNRIAKLANNPTAPLSGSSPSADVPARSGTVKGRSKVSPATADPTADNPRVAFGGLGASQSRS